MTHDEAKKSMAAEAYILDDLETAERNAFEEHFFDCTDCAADVLDAAKIADGIRTGTNVVPFRHYSRWAAAAAVAAVAVGLAYTYVVRIAPNSGHPSTPAGQRAAVSAPEQFIDLDAARAAQAAYVVAGNKSVSVGFIIPLQDPHPPYFCELRDDAGGFIGSTMVTKKEEAENPVSLFIPAGKFHKGHHTYTLQIRGDREIPAYHFAVEVQ
jgi:hypothetical protein